MSIFNEKIGGFGLLVVLKRLSSKFIVFQTLTEKLLEKWRGFFHLMHDIRGTQNDPYSSATISYVDDNIDEYTTSTIAVTLPRSLFNIKTPQLIGIILGLLTFLITITTVIVLLYRSGSIDRLKHELSDNEKKDGDVIVDHMAINSLQDELIRVSKTLTKKPQPTLALGHRVYLKVYKATDRDACLAACDGRAIYGGCTYNPVRLFAWFNYPDDWTVEELFKRLYDHDDDSQRRSAHLIIVDKQSRQYIGMLSLLDNQPESLTIRIGQIWLTPSFQNSRKHLAHEAMYLVLNWIFGEKYRRVTVETDVRNIIYRKFLERCGFKCEAVLRKHGIFKGCKNRDNAIYTILNSEYRESVRDNLRKVCALPEKPSGRKLASIQGGIGVGVGLLEGGEMLRGDRQGETISKRYGFEYPRSNDCTDGKERWERSSGKSYDDGKNESKREEMYDERQRTVIVGHVTIVEETATCHEDESSN